MSQARTDLLHLVEVLEGAQRVDAGGKPALLIEGDLEQVLRDLPGLWLRASSGSGDLAEVAVALGLPGTASVADMVGQALGMGDALGEAWGELDKDDTNDDCPCSSCEVDHV